MNMLKWLSIPFLTALFLSGCASTYKGSREIKMPQMQQNTYLSHAKPPQQFGFAVHPVKDGIAYRGTSRLHPNHFAIKSMARKGLPVIKVRGRAARNTMHTLIDVSSPASWMEFTTSRDFNAHFLGINDEVVPYRGGYNTGGVNAYAGVVTQVRINQLFMENVPFYIRMATGSIGPLARGIRSPRIDAVMGYDNLRNFEFIQFDFNRNTISFSSTQPYTPNEERLVNTAKIVRLPGYGLAIQGFILDQPTPVILDPAGHFSFARGDAKVSTTSKIRLGNLSFRQVPTLVLPVHTTPPRVGRKLLAPYIITVCNRQGVVYFEIPPE